MILVALVAGGGGGGEGTMPKDQGRKPTSGAEDERQYSSWARKCHGVRLGRGVRWADHAHRSLRSEK